MAQPYIITVILNTNRREDTLECLASLQQNAYPNHKTIVLDNQSTDGSVQAIHSSFPNVQILELQENLGYAGNNNIGIEAALAQGADWVFVLNEDTILDPECLSNLIKAGESDSQIGIVGPMVYHHNEPDIIQSAGGILSKRWDSIHIAQNERDIGQFDQTHSVDWISGCAIMVRRGVIQQVGMLDVRFFYYWEETEWCLRAGKAGWKVVHVPDAKLWHKGVRRDYQPRPHVTYYDTRNRLLMQAKHHAPFGVRIYTWSKILSTLISWTVKPRWRSMRDHRNAMFRGMVDFSFHRLGRQF